MKIFFSHQFSPFGRAGGSHLLRYSGLAIADYGCALKCLAYGSLQLVQNPGNIKAYKTKINTGTDCI